MASRLPPLNALKAFEAAARHLSVKKAAAELSVTPAAVSHQIKALEDYLGLPLFHRHNRALELTEAARACLPKLREGFDNLAQAVERLRAHRGGGMLTVSAAPSFAARWLMPRLHRFLEAYPDIDVRVSARLRQSADGGRRAATAERATVDTWLADSDVAILYGHGDYPGFRVDKLFPLTITPICSPRLLTDPEHPLLKPEDLRHQMLLHDDTGDLYDGVSFWDLWLKAAKCGRPGPEAGAPFQPRRARVRGRRRGLWRGGDDAGARGVRPQCRAAGDAVRAARAARIRLLPGEQRGFRQPPGGRGVSQVAAGRSGQRNYGSVNGDR